MSKEQEKKEKKKAIYVDDGSTIADMTGVGRPKYEKRSRSTPRAPFKEQMRTYFDAVKLMILPMLAVLGIIAIAFLIVYVIL